MPELDMQLQGVKELRDRFARSPIIMKEVMRDTIEVATLMAEGTAKANAPIDKGILRGSIHSEVRSIGNDIVGIVGTNIEYAQFQESGTGIYGPNATPIVPKQARVLAFPSKSGGMIFARSVAGSRPRRFMAKGMEAVKNNMAKIKDAGIQAARKKLGF